MIIEQLQIGFMANFCYIIADEKSKEGLIIDPGWDAQNILSKVKELGLQIKYAVGTHAHPDHIQELEHISKITGAKSVLHEDEKIKVDILVKDNDTLKLGDVVIKIIHTPGHTPGGICLYTPPHLFTGDTLFSGGGFGRTDLPGGNNNDLEKSLSRLFSLPDQTIIYPGHNYGNTPTSTIKEEKEQFTTIS